MTTSDWENQWESEIMDSQKYSALAEKTPDLADVLMKMAHEEKNHADIIKHIIIKKIKE